jgi:TolB-like protein
MYRARLLQLIALTALSFVWSSSASGYEAEVKALATKLVTSLEAANQTSAAVLDFEDLHGSTTDLGHFLAQELTDSLVSVSKTLSVVDRTNLQQLLRENKLSMEGLVNPETSKKLGKLIGIDTVIVGTVTTTPDKVRISVRAVDVETGRILATQSSTFPVTGELTGLVSSGSVSNVPLDSPARVQADVITECDRLAASPLDPDRPRQIPGVYVSKIDTNRAGAACDEAIKKHPDAARMILNAGLVATAISDHVRGRQLFERAAALGYRAAVYALGVAYWSGQGVPQNYKEARRWFEKAAVAGVPAATAMLGLMSLKGQGVTQSYTEARSQFEKAAALGDPVGMTNLGVMYLNGDGVPQNQTEGRRLIERAASLGDPGAQNVLQQISR